MTIISRPKRPGEREQRFEKIFVSSHPRVLAYALRRTEDRASAEDVVSEVFLIVWRRLDSVPTDHLPWILRTARNVLANSRRTARRRRGARSADQQAIEIPDPQVAIPELIADRDAFAVAFRALRASDRELLTLVAWDDLESQEAAKVLGCSAAAFSIRLHRARRRLLKELRTSGHSLGEGNQQPKGRARPDAAEAG